MEIIRQCLQYTLQYTSQINIPIFKILNSKSMVVFVLKHLVLTFVLPIVKSLRAQTGLHLHNLCINIPNLMSFFQKHAIFCQEIQIYLLLFSFCTPEIGNLIMPLRNLLLSQLFSKYIFLNHIGRSDKSCLKQ